MNVHRATIIAAVAALLLAGCDRVSTAQDPVAASAPMSATNPTREELAITVESLMAQGRRVEAGAANQSLQAIDSAHPVAIGVRKFLADMQVDEKFEASADRPIPCTLDRKLPEVVLNDVRFDEAVEFFRDVRGASIFVDWVGLAAAGIRHDTRINVRLDNVKFEAALTIVLDSVARPGKPLEHAVDRGAIVIRRVGQQSPTGPFKQEL